MSFALLRRSQSLLQSLRLGLQSLQNGNQINSTALRFPQLSFQVADPSNVNFNILWAEGKAPTDKKGDKGSKPAGEKATGEKRPLREKKPKKEGAKGPVKPPQK